MLLSDMEAREAAGRIGWVIAVTWGQHVRSHSQSCKKVAAVLDWAYRQCQARNTLIGYGGKVYNPSTPGREEYFVKKRGN